MNFKDIDAIADLDAKRKKVNTSITRATYSGDALNTGNRGQWCLSDIVLQFDDSACAAMAAMHVHGKTSRGKYKGQSIVGDIQVKLKVLTRQACYADKNGDRISKDPTTDEFVLFTDDAVDGDIVRVKLGQKVIDLDTEKEYTLKELNYMKMSGEPTYLFTDYKVKDGHIIVNGADAHQLLSTKGKRLVAPQFERPHSVYQREPTKGNQRRITNWLFEEVSNTSELTAGQKAAQTRKANAKKLDNDN